MKLNNLAPIAILLSASFLVSCAGAQLQNEMEQKRHYSSEDMQLIKEQAKPYAQILAAGMSQSNAFNTAPRADAERRLRTVWCNCFKKLGDQCRKAPSGLSKTEKSLWVKANAAELANGSMGTSRLLVGGDTRPTEIYDGAECE